MTLSPHPRLTRLLKLELNPDHFVVFGSAPLLMHGLRDEVSDLDVVARGAAWERASTLAESLVTSSLGGMMASFDNGAIQVSTGWISPGWRPDDLIDGAEIIAGIRFARLDQVLEYKRQLRREKDLKDIEVLERRLQAGDDNDRPTP
ncbi:hypothetical protein [Paractinoplanes atraurantiacus]|uniref:Nucleotidyl transferase AbiEii toxin, Type IV TA system n=1 Tax=Paractinoplanes atraurantiacus TaxID=1036182 RepID=A0A285FV25_9ACTN|nr:hypothetical protein [Actinoplanes atraurantiacus]SNY15190.1 hypothetical protein SAMN05421748_1011292 [Actinoplanes atraurantiacus]